MSYRGGLVSFDFPRKIWYDWYMTHDCTYALDLDGSITCSFCGAMDDDMDNSIFETQVDFE